MPLIYYYYIAYSKLYTYYRVNHIEKYINVHRDLFSFVCIESDDLYI